MKDPNLMREAMSRQGTKISVNGTKYLFAGQPDKVAFAQGGEGLVQLATNQSTGVEYRIKCFWDPNSLRKQRCEMLVKQQLANLTKERADALGGAPFEMTARLGSLTPFAVIMKNIKGVSWANFKEAGREALRAGSYPPPHWPSLQVRSTWAFGLATAVLDMEKRNFIHADLSDGNVVVTPGGQYSGDMALVDFDAFVHPQFPHLDRTCRGTPGYAAPEIWSGQSVQAGSDRIGMAILIQEFLVFGDAAITPEDADSFLSGYDQEADISVGKGEAFPYFAAKYPELADLLIQTFKARKPQERPSPALWRPYLRSLALNGTLRKRLVNVSLEPYPIGKGIGKLQLSDSEVSLDLSRTKYAIRATLCRNSDGSIDVVVHALGVIRIKEPNQHWPIYGGSTRIPIRSGMLLSDPEGKSGAMIQATEKK